MDKCRWQGDDTLGSVGRNRTKDEKESISGERLVCDNGLAGQLKKQLAERMLTAELNHHLTSEAVQTADNHRKGSSHKTVITPGGELQLDILRDRLATFEPQLVAKY